MTPAEFERVPSAVLCQLCWHRKGEHGGDNNPHRPYACPADAPFPRWSLRVERLKGTEAAAKRYDSAVARFWTRRTTTFKAVTP